MVDVEDRTPTGILVGVGSVAVVVAALVPVTDPGWRFAVVAGVVGLFAVFSHDGWAVAAVVVVAWLVVNGFLVDRLGELSWHGSPDMLRLMVLVLVGALGVTAGEGWRGLRGMRDGWRVDGEVHALVVENEEKERRGA